MAHPGTFRALALADFGTGLTDNLLRMLLVFYAIGVVGQDAADVMAISGAVYVTPLLILTWYGGALADRAPKRTILVWCKVGEVLLHGVGLAAILLGSLPLLYGALALASVQTAFFSPARGAILPELLPSERLAAANGVLFMLAFGALLIASPLSVVLSERFGYAATAGVCVTLAVIGLVAATRVARTEGERPSRPVALFFPREIVRSLAAMRSDGWLLIAVIGAGFFKLITTYIALNMLPYGVEVLSLDHDESSYLFLVAAVGIGAGAFVAGRLSGRGIELGLVPVGAAILTATLLLLAAVPATLLWVAAVLIALGLGWGLFVVPLTAFIQHRSPPDRVGQIIATSELLGYLGVLGASVFTFAQGRALGLDATGGFAVIAGLALALSLAAILTLPDFLLRFASVLLTRLRYRVSTEPGEHLPLSGGALLVASYVTRVDAYLLLATTQRRVRFVMTRARYDRRLMRPLYRLMGVIPLDLDAPPTITDAGDRIRAALDAGFLVCVFPEITPTPDGAVQPFRLPLADLTSPGGHPIIPVRLHGGFGSRQSLAPPEVRAAQPWRLRRPVHVRVGPPLPADASAEAVRSAVAAL